MSFSDSEFSNSVKSLNDFLQLVDNGSIGLPGFQRKFVWTETQQRRLYASMICGEPIGGVLIQKKGTNTHQFGPRSLHGLPDLKTDSVDLILDGQQRLTTIYKGFGKNGRIEKNKKKYQYVLNVNKLLDELPEPVNLSEEDPSPLIDFIELVPLNNDSPLEQVEKGVINLSTLGDANRASNWLTEFARQSDLTNCQDQEHTDCAEDDCRLESSRSLFEAYGLRGLTNIFVNYRLPWQELASDLPIQVVENYFVRVNSGGTALRPLELLSARLFDRGGKQFRFEEELTGLAKSASSLASLGIKFGSSKGLAKPAELPVQLLCLKLQQGKSVLGSGNEVEGIGRTAILSIPRESIWGTKVKGAQLSLAAAVKALDEAAQFLAQSCGVVSAQMLPQQSMLLPLASHFLMRSKQDRLDDSVLRLWYFTICLLQQFHGNTQFWVGQNETFLDDLSNGRDFEVAIGKTKDQIVSEIEGLDFKKKLKDQHKISGLGVMAMLVQSGAIDWQKDASPTQVKTRYLSGEKIELHHTVPESAIKSLFQLQQGGQSTRWIAVMSPISASRNRDLSDADPEAVFKTELGASAQRTQILESHHIMGASLNKWRKAASSRSAFDDYVAARSEALRKFALSRYQTLWDDALKP